MNFITKIWNGIVGFFAGISPKILEFIKPAVSAILRSGGDTLLQIAFEAVIDMSKTDMLNSEKREIAFKKIRNRAKELGLQALESDIRLAIELAVKFLKEQNK